MDTFHLKLGLIAFWGFNFLVVEAQKVNEYYFDAGNGLSLLVGELGQETNPKVIFLHGGPGDNHQNFFPHFTELSADYHLIFYDQTDAGKSVSKEKPVYTIQLEVENLEKLRKHLNIEKLNLLGHSWGSILALSYAKSYPENVNKILLTGSIGTDASYFQLFAQNLQRKLKQEDYVKIQQLSMEGASRQRIHEEVMLPLYFVDSQKIPEMTKTSINFEVNQSIAMDIFKNFDVKSHLGKFTFPIVVIQGKQDLLTLDEIKNGFQDSQNIQFQEIENAGHWSFVEQPQQFRQLFTNFFK